MDLSLLRLSKKDKEIKGGKVRYEAQFDFPDSLLAWAADPYSDFFRQSKGFDSNHPVKAKVFIKQTYEQIMDNRQLSMVIPEKILKEETFQSAVVNILNEVYEDFFFNEKGPQKTLNSVERQDFIVLTDIRLLEHFCAVYEPDSLDTTCRSHIDRGMVMTTLLYLYASVKGGQVVKEETLDYMELIIFPPSLLFSQRATHDGRIKRLLSVMSRLLDSEVINKVQKRKTPFTNVHIAIPGN